MRIAIALICISTTLCLAQPYGQLRKINGTGLFLSIEGHGDPVVVIHGGPGLNHSYFKPHLDPLSKDFQLIFYDQRASGRSAIPSPDSITLKMFVEDVEQIRQSIGEKKINIIAHSWGVVVAIMYALEHPDHVNKMVLSNPAMLSREYDQEAAQIRNSRTTKADSLAKASLMAKGMNDVKSYEDFFLLSFKPSAANPDNLLRLNLNLQENFQAANKALFGGLMRDPSMSKNLYDQLNKLNVPVLVIDGKFDIIPPAATKRLFDNLPKGAMLQMKKSGHFPFLEEPAMFNETVARFLKHK